MKIILFFFIYSLSFQAHPQSIEINGKDYTWDDLEHSNRGCPANSSCSKPMGEKIFHFKNFLRENKQRPNLSQKLEAYRKKYGLPIHFLMLGEKPSLDPVVWDSRCEIHRNKDKKEEVTRALQFFHNNPKSELVKLDPVYIGDTLYEIPYEEGPLMIDNGEIIIATEYDDVFYYLAIDSKGKWRVTNISKLDNDKALSIREDTPCAEDKKKEPEAPYYAKTYCKKIWNKTTSKVEVITLSWSCP